MVLSMRYTEWNPYHFAALLATHLHVCTVPVSPATAPGAAPVPAAGPGLTCGPDAPGPHPPLTARRLLQLRPALPLLHPGQLLPRPGPGGEGGQSPGSCGESEPRGGRGQIRLMPTRRFGGGCCGVKCLQTKKNKKLKGKTVTVNGD